MPFSGKDGDVLVGGAQVCELTSWSFNPTSNNPSWSSNKSGGFKKREAGVKDGSGSFEGKYDEDVSIFSLLREGSKVVLTLKLNASISFTVNAIVDDLTVEVDLDDGEIVSFTVNFSIDGIWTPPT